MYKMRRALSLVKAVEAQSMFDDAGRDEDENRILGRVVSDSTGQSGVLGLYTALLIQLLHIISNPEGRVLYSA